jgi:predicted transcriptional regulator of viral defense system
MFNIDTRKRLIRRLQHPTRLKALQDQAADLMKGTRYQSIDNFITAMENEDIIQVHTVEARNGRKIPVYCSAPMSEVDAYELVTCALPDGYFANLTAIYHHALTNQVPNSVYWCHETLVPRKRKSPERLSDTRIRSAFLKPHRHTSFVIQHNQHEILITAGARGSDHGVEQILHKHSPCTVGSRVTCIERTLIDAVVSPHYNGGVMSLCDYFRAAQSKLDIARMLDIYQKLDFVYPYAQSIGFFLEHCGMAQQAQELRSAYPPRQRFYVDHDAKTTWAYDKRWMVFYPKGLVDED